MAFGTFNTTDFLTKIGGYGSSIGAEIPAFDPVSQRLFVVAGSVVEVLNFTDPANPTKIADLSLNMDGDPDGATSGGFTLLPNSVAVGKVGTVSEGIVTVAIAITNQTTLDENPGEVQFFNAANGAYLGKVTVGYLPDMLTFTPDGTKILTANEGQPNDAYTFDPVGSVSIIDIIDLSNGVINATVQEASFESFNSQIDSLRASGVRIFGPGSSVAQDLEPEYITFNGDGTKAWVTLQENNAIAVVDVATATVESILPLGLKNHNSVTVKGLETFEFNNLPTIGSTEAGQELFLGGFSGLFYEGKADNGNLKFITHTDRGPNGEPTGINRPFLLPDFTPEIVRFELNRSTGQITLTERIQLKDSTGKLLSGLPNTSLSTNASQAYNDEVPVDLRGNVLNLDSLGGDFEGIVVNPQDNSFWMVDEYRPAIYHFDSDGKLRDRFVPTGTAEAAGQAVGTFGTEALPAVLAQRRQNRGFEAVALNTDTNKLYAFVQSPLRNPTTLTNGNLNNLNNIRVVEFDLTTKAVTAQYLYRLDNGNLGGDSNTRPDKVGDAVYIGNGEFLIVERDDDSINSGDALNTIEKKVYRFNLAGATNIDGLDAPINGKTLDQMTPDELIAAGITSVRKMLHIDLATAGYNGVEKVEGLALVDADTIAVINDNDFQVAGITIDTTTGTFTPDPSPEPVVLGLITTNSNGIDPSDRDVGINIRNVPVFGMYQPDSIASFTVNGQTYYVTANEGDSRDYSGFSEEIRVSSADYLLDPTLFPDAATLKQNANLGRLQLTKATGDLDSDGDIDQIQALGSRSFSIWDSNGKLVYDSGDDFEQIVASVFPANFNSDNGGNNVDNRSDNKGPEPEGVAVGTINNRTYAFIGLERVGGVMVYEVTNPTAPNFVQYINPRDFAADPQTNATDSGPEGLTFIAASDSPNGQPLVVVANEISKTIAVYAVNAGTRISDIQGAGHLSPLRGQTVSGVPGIVTALAANGFYLQDPRPDNNEATADGIFVFTSSAPTVAIGDAVQVSGTVTEFTPGASSINPTNNLSITQITSPTITLISSGNPLPAALILGTNGRIPPNSLIQSNSLLADSFTVNNLLMAEIQEVRPTSNTSASGSVSFSFDQATNTLTVNGTFGNLSSALREVNGSPIHIHTGSVGNNGGIFKNLTVTPNADNLSGTFTGTFVLSESEIATLRNGGFYVNLHTMSNPSGELRGQLFPNVAENSSFDPTTDGLDFYESLEGMRVQINNPVATSPTATFGTSQEIWVLGDDGANATSRTVAGGSLITETDYNPERIQIDDLRNSLVLPDVKVGDRLSDITGVVNYDFGNYEVLVSEAPTVVQASNLTKEITNLVGNRSRLTVATFNVENLGGNAAQSRFEAIAAAIVTNLKSPDIISLEEIQDNNGATNDGTITADQTYGQLIAAIAAAGGPTYSYRQIDPVNNQDGGQTGGNIRVGFLFNDARVDFVDRGENTVDRSTTGVTVTDSNNDGKPDLSLSPGRIVDNNLSNGDTFNASRKPLVGEFTFNGETVFVIGNHFNSKGGDQPLFGRVQPPEQFTEVQRNLQAQAVADFVTNLKTADPNAKIVVLGDLNDFEFSQPLSILEGSGLTNLIETLPANERYTYNFEGNAQTLDQILVSHNLAANAQYDVVRINSEFSDQLSDHDPSIVSLNIPFQLQLLHASDQEAGIPALKDILGFSAVMNALDAKYENTLKLSSGDLFISGPFFNASLDLYGQVGVADMLIQNELGWDAAAVGNHEFDAGSGAFYNLLAPKANMTGVGIGESGYLGAQFPYLATNLNYSSETNLQSLVVANGQAPKPNSLAGSVVVEIGGEKVGIVAAVVPYLSRIANIGRIQMLTDATANGIEANAQTLAANIQPVVDALVSQGINKVVLMTHLQQFEIEQALAPKLKNVDVLMGGGSHRVMASDGTMLRQDEVQTPPELLQPYPQLQTDADGNPIYLINTGANYRYLSQLIVEFDENGFITKVGEDSGAYATDIAGVDRLYEASITTYDQVKTVADPDIVAVVENVETFISGLDGKIYGNTAVYLNGLRSSVRTEETNLGNLTADANLWYAEQYGFDIDISIKNGGGIRDQIGLSYIEGGTNELIQLPPQANPSVGKEQGDISQLDIGNSLRFDNKLSVADITAQGLKDLAEHFVAPWAVGVTPGQFGQIGGFKFSYDPDRTAIAFNRDSNGLATSVRTPGQRIQNLVMIQNDGSEKVIVENGELKVDANQTYKMVILDFLAAGGDGYPTFYFSNIVKLADLNAPNVPDQVTSLAKAGEQDALAEYLTQFYPDASKAFNQADTPIELDTRIQNLNYRSDTILPPSPPALVSGTPASDLFEAGTHFNGNGDTLFTGAGDDVVDTPIGGPGKGFNRVNLGSGNDTIFVGNGDRANGGSGDDQFDATDGMNYRLSGGKGNDIFYLGANGRALGGDGNDEFYVQFDGDNLLSGGAGADKFWLLTDLAPDTPNTVVDFTQGTDVIGIMNQDAGIGFDQIQRVGNSLALNGDVFAILQGVNTANLTAADFVFM
ncbi:MAG: choice-of-anchor I family protein [Snowella sp.]|nr:choice-of-anchor I family protein [Snowella sp.]